MKLNSYIIFFLFLTMISLISCVKDNTPTFESEPLIEQNIYLHESFRITDEILKEIISDQPQKIQNAILADPHNFLSLTIEAFNLPIEYLILVDKQHALSRDIAPAETEDLANYPEMKTWFGYMQVSKDIFPILQQIDQDSKADGVVITFTDGYRSYDTQEFTYNYWVERDGKEIADRTSAQPGKSQHQLGTAIDFGDCTPDFQNTVEGKWVMENLPKYGFSLSYPEGLEDLTGYMFECWHWRYISPIGVELQEKYFDNTQQYLTLFWNTKRELLESYFIE